MWILKDSVVCSYGGLSPSVLKLGMNLSWVPRQEFLYKHLIQDILYSPKLSAQRDRVLSVTWPCAYLIFFPSPGPRYLVNSCMISTFGVRYQIHSASSPPTRLAGRNNSANSRRVIHLFREIHLHHHSQKPNTFYRWSCSAVMKG